MAAESTPREAKIIVLDDEKANVRLLERILQREGYTNVIGLTESRRLFDGDVWPGVDLVLLDLHMPSPDGFAILTHVQQLQTREQPPVLVLTADVTSDSRNRALDIGASDYVTKPFDPVEVLLRVRNLLRIRFLHLRLLRTNRVLQDRLITPGS